MSCCSACVLDVEDFQSYKEEKVILCSTSPSPKLCAEVFINHVKKGIVKCIFETNKLIYSISQYVIVLKCSCGIMIGIDRISMESFMKVVSRALQDMSSFILQNTVYEDYVNSIERWISSFCFYDQVLWSAVIDIHMDKKNIPSCCSSIRNIESEILSDRKECINTIKTILYRLLTDDKMQVCSKTGQCVDEEVTLLTSTTT